MQYSLTLPRKCPPSKTTLSTQWWVWKVDLDIIVCCLGFAWVFLAVLGHPDRCPTHRALLPATSTSLHVLLLSHSNLWWDGSHQSCCPGLLLTPTLPAEGYLDSFQPAAAARPGHELWKIPTSSLPRQKRKLRPTTLTRKSSSTG